MSFAFAKTDHASNDLLEHEDPEVQALVAARLGIKTTIGDDKIYKALINIAHCTWDKFLGASLLPMPPGVFRRSYTQHR